MRRPVLALLLASTLVSPAAAAASQAELSALGAGMGVRVAILDNQPAQCPGQSGGCFLSELDLTMPATLPADLATGDLEFFFGSVNPVIRADSDAFSMRLVNGDLHVLQLRPGVTLKRGETYRIRLWSQGHFFSQYYVLPNMFLVSGDLSAPIRATQPATDPDSGLEVLPFVHPMTDETRLATAGPGDATHWQTAERAFDLYTRRNASRGNPADIAIIPQPTLVERHPGPPIDLRGGVRLDATGVSRADLSAALADLAAAGVMTQSQGPRLLVDVSTKAHTPAESYRLTAHDGEIRIVAGSATGARYAIESLAQQAAFEHRLLRPLSIEDTPRFGFRGLEIDLARNFHSKAEVLKVIEQMGRYKLNTLHLHLGDDEGWRLAIARFPELTEVGAWRCWDPSETRCLLPELGSGPDRNTPVNGFLTRSDYIEILKAAKARGITVIPSFDMPGHSRAAIHSMEVRYHRLVAAGRSAEAERFRLLEPGDTTQYRSVQNYNDNTLNVCLDSTYRFIDVVVDEIAEMHAAAGIPLRTYHIGADETAGAWSGSPACQRMMVRTGRKVTELGPMFIERVSASLARRHIAVAGWSDGLDHVDPAKMPRHVQSDIWSDLFTAAPADANRATNLGWKTVIAVPNVLYFDMPYAPHPLERGYDWGTRGTDTFSLFSFMPENLPANASVRTDIHDKPTTVTDHLPLKAGRSIAGAQGNLWSETVRRDGIVDYMLFPRLLALAERSWRRGPWEPAYSAGTTYAYGDSKVDTAALDSDWASFASKMPFQLAGLERAGILYRLAPPGARLAGGMLEADTEFPDQTIEYRVNGGGWTRYARPVRLIGPVELRTRSYDGRRTSRIVTVTVS